MRDDPTVTALVARVGDGDRAAWDELIERYAPLVWSICVRYQLSRPDIDDVGQSVWLLLVEQIGNLREPAALPGWLATTAKRECLRVLRAARRHDHADPPPEDQMPPDTPDSMIELDIIKAERDAALRAAFAGLPPVCHELLSMLISDPVPAYAQVSVRLGMAIGSIGRPGPVAWSGCGVRRIWSPSSAATPGPSRMRSREVSIVTDSWDDETVLAALREAQRARQAVPPEFIEAAKSAYAWHNIDAELAQLTYDSTRESAEALSERAEAAPIRALTFSSAHLTIELDVTPDALIGQVVPAQAATVVVQSSTGSETAFPTDETGCFSIRPIPPATFRLHCKTGAGLEVLTRWIAL